MDDDGITGDLLNVRIHFLETMIVPTKSGLTAESELMNRGSELVLTAEVLAAGVDRNGRSWIDKLDNEQAQIERWGVVRFRRGSWPANTPTWVHGDQQWADARERRRLEAHQVSDPDRRSAAFADLRREFGDAPSTSRTLNVISERR